MWGRTKEKGTHELMRRIRKTEDGSGKNREQERETMDKNTLCYCIPNLQKLVHQVPLCGKVLASL